jgi:hypothetical protein
MKAHSNEERFGNGAWITLDVDLTTTWSLPDEVRKIRLCVEQQENRWKPRRKHSLV